jgi:hypothetical protein
VGTTFASGVLPSNFSTLGISAGGHVSNVDTITTYTGDTPQTGDAFARLGVAGVGLTNLGDTRIANLDATVSSRTKPADTQAAVTTVTNPVTITSSIKKNSIATGFMFLMTDSTNHNPSAGLTVVGTRAIDGGAFSGLTNSGTIASVGSGTYSIDLSAADTNGNHLMLRFTNATSDDLNIEIITQP